jgi:hypothetical protein
MCFSGYITASTDTPSKSGLYFTDLAGCTVRLLDDLTKEDHNDWSDCFDYLYGTAQRNLRIDVQRAIAGRFHIDKKLNTRETSETISPVAYNSGGTLAGVKIRFYLPKYARIQILSIGLDSQAPGAKSFYIYKDDENGELLSTINATLAGGKETVQVYQEFEENTLFVCYNPSQIAGVKTTKNRYYMNDIYAPDMSCAWNCYGVGGSVWQVNNGGLNVKFVIYCSIEKFICENLPLFQFALLNRLGVDAMKERITTQRVNQTSVLTEQRAKELLQVFNDDYKAALDSATMSISMSEDPICFMCKNSVSAKSNLP